MDKTLDKTIRNSIVCSATLILLVIFFTPAPTSDQQPRSVADQNTPSANQNQKVAATFGKLPFRFEQNVGQTDPSVHFLAHGTGYSMFFTSDEVVMVLAHSATVGNQHISQVSMTSTPSLSNNNISPSPTVLRFHFSGANPAPQIVGDEELLTKSNYFIGNDATKWYTNVPNYAKTVYKGIYPGVDLAYYGTNSTIEYDFAIAPGTNPGIIHMEVAGAEQVDVQAGELILHTSSGEIHQPAPHIYQDINGVRKDVAGSYILESSGNISFNVAAYDHSQQLVIDPILPFSSYLGGSGTDAGHSIAVDSQGNTYVTGSTMSTDFPTSQNAYQRNYHGLTDAFITKVSASGSSVVYSTYLGGSGSDAGYGVAVDSQGAAYVSGNTSSNDFPLLNAYQTVYNGPSDAFITKLDISGQTIQYSTYFGGYSFDINRGNEISYSIAVDNQGDAYITGFTDSDYAFPIRNPLAGQNTVRASDAFVAKINTLAVGDYSLVYSTLLGGTSDDQGRGIAVDSSGNVYVTGETNSNDFPVVSGSFQTTYGGNDDAFVSKLTYSAPNLGLAYSSYLGGNGQDAGLGVAVDSNGFAYVTGSTGGSFPTVKAYQPNYGGGPYDAFVTKVNGNGSVIVYSTYLGGGDWDSGQSIGIDGAGNAYIIGFTYSTNFPVYNPIQANHSSNNGSNVFVTMLLGDGTALGYSTYLSGNGSDIGLGIAVDSFGNVYLTGQTYIPYPNPSETPTLTGTPIPGFPTVDPFQQNFGGGDSDAFVAKISNGIACPAPNWCLSTNPGGSGNSVLNGVSVANSADIWAVGDANVTPGATPIGGQPLVEHLSGSPTPTWANVIVPTPSGATSVHLASVAAYNPTPGLSEVWSVGTSYASGGSGCNPCALVEHLSNGTWTATVLATPTPGTTQMALNRVALGATIVNSPGQPQYREVWAVGSFANAGTSHPLVKHWTGTTWEDKSPPYIVIPSGTLNSVVVDANNSVWAVGFTSSGNTRQPLLLQYSGASWTSYSIYQFSSSDAFLNGIDTFLPNEIWAVGGYYNGSKYVPLIARWDSKKWYYGRNIDSPGSSYNELHSVFVTGERDVWTVGEYSNAHNATPTYPNPRTGSGTLILRWHGIGSSDIDGPFWDRITDSPNPGIANQLLAVAAQPASQPITSSWAVGNYAITNGPDAALIGNLSAPNPPHANPTPYPTSTSYYINTMDTPSITSAGCSAGARGDVGIIVLDFGRPIVVAKGQPALYGTYLFANRITHTHATPNTDQIATASEAFAAGYHQGRFPGPLCPTHTAPQVTGIVTITISISNDETGLPVGSPPAALTLAHAHAWATMVTNVQNYASAKHYSEMMVAAGIDAEPCFVPNGCSAPPTVTNYPDTYNWVTGYAFTRVSLLYDYGSTDGAPCTVPNPITPDNSCSRWSADQLYQIAYGVLNTAALPEVYTNEYARKWYLLKLYGINTYGGHMTFAGLMTECGDATCPNPSQPSASQFRPEQAWQVLWLQLNADPKTRQDLTIPTDIGHIY